MKDEIRIIVATIAFGMGINKSNVRFVVHVDLPKNIEGFYQETGRAGRDGLHSEAILFYGAGDVMKLRRFAEVEGNEQQTKIMLQKLDKMSRFCEIKTCRRKYLLNYFGDEASEYCGSCDVCLHKPVLNDATIISQKILSAVVRLKESFGMRYVVDILKGSNNEKIREEHKKLTVFGIGKDLPKEQWLHYTKELINYGYLAQSEGQFPVLRLTEKGRTVLYKKEAVFLSSPVHIEIGKEPQIYQQHSYEQELFENLKVLRDTTARKENVPPHIIFSDSTLLDLATYLPVTQSDLLKISGFGAYKTQRYGPAFLDMVRDYCVAFRLQTRIDLKQPKPEKKSSSNPERPSETRQLSLQMYKDGKTMGEIAADRALSVSTIESHLSYYITTQELQLDNFVDLNNQQLIRKAAAVFGSGSLKLLKENLPPEIGYGEIRMVLAAMTAEKA